MRIIWIFIFTIAMLSAGAQTGSGNVKTSPNENTLLWEVSGGNLSLPSYLFGTFHLLCKQDIHFSEALKSSLKSSQAVYFEMDLDDASMMLNALSMMNMEKGKKLTDLFKPDEYTRLERFFKDSLKMGLTMFQSMKPFFLESMLYTKVLPCSSITGVEKELMKLAKGDKKDIRGLETLAFQASVFDSIPYTEQATELLSMIDSFPKFRLEFDSFVTVYKQQRMDQIEKLFSKTEAGIEKNRDILLDGRNKDWVKQLKNIMPKEAVFVAVGAGHLIGNAGLIALLRKEGYKVRPVLNE